MKKAVFGTHVLGAHRFIVHPLMPYLDTDRAPEEVLSLNEAFFAELADYAKGYGVTVCVENLPFPSYPLTTVEQVCALVDKLDRDNLKVCLDTGHAAIFFGSDVGAAVRYIGDRLEAVHVHDNMGEQDEHLIPGDGIIDWDGFTSALKEIGFGGVMSLETSPKHGQHPESEWADREKNLVGIALSFAEKAV
jgi:sugar phosphate isomerase/epimerase